MLMETINKGCIPKVSILKITNAMYQKNHKQLVVYLHPRIANTIKILQTEIEISLYGSYSSNVLPFLSLHASHVKHQM